MKTQFVSHRLLAMCLLAFAVFLSAGSARAETVVALDSSNRLLTFDSATPGTATLVPVTGLGSGEELIGIDFRPSVGALYGVVKNFSGAGRVLRINPQTGAAAFSSSLTADPTDSTEPYTALSGNSFGVDFNPVPDRLRIVSDTGKNLRINVDTGFVITDSDINPGTPSITTAAYTNSFAGATSTTLYDIDVAADTLFVQNPPNNGTITAVGAGLGVDASGTGGFDIVSSRTADGTATHTAFAALTVGASTGLYSINLTTGTVTLIGNVGAGDTPLRGLTCVIGAPPATAYTIDTTTTSLLRFNTATPAVVTNLGPVTGLAGGETIIGMDFRPADGLLYAVAKDAGNGGRLFTIDTATAVASLVSALAADPSDSTNPFTTFSGTNFGVDFNPVPDRIRVVSDSGQNLRVNPANGFVLTDEDLNPGTPSVSGVGYINSFPGATTTTLFDLDAGTDQLLIQNPPNNGTLTSVGSLGVDATAINGFDIRASGEAFAILTVGGTAGLYSINLATGAATLIGAVNSGASTVRGLAFAGKGVLQFSATDYSVGETNGFVSLTINRIGGTDGVVSVIVNTSDGTATAGSDYLGSALVATFGNGALSLTTSIPLFTDGLAEPTETFTIALSDPAGGAIVAAQNTATVSITDDTAPPSVVSGPTANPNPAFTNLNVAFSVVPNPSNATVSWDFGDGSPAATGLNVNHIFTAASTYTVTVTLQNPITSASATATLQLPVNAPDAGGTSTLPGTQLFKIKKGSIKLTDKKNTITLAGTIPITGSETIASPLTVSVNGVTRTLTLSTKGAAKSDDASIKLKFKSKKGVISAQDAGLTFAITGSDIPAQLASNVGTDGNGQPKLVVVKVQFGGHTYSYIAAINIVAKGKTKAATFGNK